MTLCAPAYVPAGGVKVGGAVCVVEVYVCEAGWLLMSPVAVAIAVMVSVELTVIAPVYLVEADVGVVPSVV